MKQSSIEHSDEFPVEFIGENWEGEIIDIVIGEHGRSSVMIKRIPGPLVERIITDPKEIHRLHKGMKVKVVLDQSVVVSSRIYFEETI